MATTKEIYNMASDSDSTIVNSDEDHDHMSENESENQELLALANPFLLVNTGQMFVEGKRGEGDSGAPRKSRRKRKGEANANGKEKRDKKGATEANRSIKKVKAKTKTENMIFPNFWATTPDHPAEFAPLQLMETENNEINLLEALSKILEKHKIDGAPALEINELIQTAVGQICALRSSIHNMEARLSKLEEGQSAKGQTYAEVTNNKVKEDSVRKKDNKATTKAKGKQAAPVQASTNVQDKTTTQAVAKSKQLPKPAIKTVRQPETLKPKPSIPTLIVKPTVDGASFKELKGKLEESINLKPLGVKVINCTPSAGNGVIIRVQTNEMLEKLQKTINEHTTLKNLCQARTPKGRSPQIIIYDIPKTDEPRDAEEIQFLEQLRSSNDLPSGDMRVIFRRKGRGNLQHWVVSLTPEIFKHLKDEKRLHLGFGSFKFKEFLDPLRCFKCHKFGHVNKNCLVQDVLCSRCPGIHVFRRRSNLQDKQFMSSTPSSTVVWKFFQANLGRSKIATKELKELKSNQNDPSPDIYLIQEPYTYKGKVVGLPLSWKILSAENAKVLVAVRNNNINIIARHVSSEIVIADLFDSNGQITVASIYFPPSKDKTRAISDLEASIKDLDTSKLVLCGDINMRSILWGPDIPDHRAADDGGPFVDFILKYNLQIINNPGSPSTFESKNGKSWIDVTTSSRGLFNKICNWTVNKNVFSDHSYLSFDISLVAGPISGSLRISKRKIYKLGNLVADKFRNAEAEISKIHTKKGLNDWIQDLTEFVRSVCKWTLPKKAAHLKVPWWDLELELQRKKTRALRFRYQRCKQDAERQLRRSLFKREEAKYRWLIKVKSRDSFEKLCVLLTSSNPFDLPYKMATGKCKKKMIFNTIFDQQGNKTKSIEETIEAIVHKLFPQEEEQLESPSQKRVRDRVAGYTNLFNERTFTKLEIREVIRGMAKNKAPGLDSINVLMAEVIHKKSPEILTGIFNKCLQIGVFPKEWKKAKLILINKPGKDPELANSYRPICLLSVLSKILDKLITQRITFLLKSRGMLHKQQHGFRNGRSCETANYELRKSIQRAMQHKFKVCLVSLDVTGAFDNVWRHSILEQLIRAECPFNLFALIKDYFEDRQVVYEISNKRWTFETQRGVPQGSCSGPLFWNLVVSTALGLALPQGCQIQAFADDLIIVVRGVNTESLTIRCNEAISRLVAWGKSHKLRFNASKTTLMPITYGGRLARNEPLQVALEGQQVTIKDQIVYLGVTWNCALTFTPHFKKVRQRVDILTYKITSVADNFYWRHNRMFKRIYTGAIEPYILYGHGAWGDRLQLITIDRFLNGIQRRPLIKLTRAFRTTSTEALQVIAGVLPLSLKAMETYTKFLLLTVKINATIGTKLFKSAEVETKRDIFDRHPADWCSVPFGTEGPVGEDIEIFTDGSGIDGKVGAALVVFYHGTEIHHEICRLEDSATVFQAETKGIHMALDYINKSKQWHRFHIFSDSKSVLQSLTCPKNTRQNVLDLKDLFESISKSKWIRLHWVKAHVGIYGNERADQFAKIATNKDSVDFKCLKSKATMIRSIRQELLNVWQVRWDRPGNGRHTHKYIPHVRFKVPNYSPFVTQFLTDHGRFPAYFYRFNLSREYSCCCGGFGNADHYILECPFTKRYWNKLIYDRDNPTTLLQNQANLIQIHKLFETVDSFVPQI
ncbi:Putative protein in type-1 retrotransposable element R1DM [Araneus ventricosus]|uniref:Retrovirus-related Pol polyprotein from type-1 retrotransposable element R1 n=1 Tax=Araneus ventricosus TaxID=182803 RepID=A0A4Y2FE08_ARAVE|nr:Putative protein in type-1 retrotransposable element R1DM [Araneus ventricosus]